MNSEAQQMLLVTGSYLQYLLEVWEFDKPTEVVLINLVPILEAFTRSVVPPLWLPSSSFPSIALDSSYPIQFHFDVLDRTRLQIVAVEGACSVF